MKRVIVLTAAMLLAFAWFASAQESEDDEATPCERACAAAEDKCLERCDGVDDPGPCEDACFEQTEKCFDKCDG